MPSISGRYYVSLKDTSGFQVAIFDSWRMLEFQHVINDVGFFHIEFYDTGDARFDEFVLDGIFEVWRSVPSMGITKYKEFEGLVRKWIRSIDSEGNKVFIAYGVEFNHLLTRRVIGYKQGTTRAEKNDYVEKVMKEFVEENLGPGASHASRVANGVMTGFSVQALSASYTLTPNWRGERSFQTILDVLKELAQYAHYSVPVNRAVDFAVVSNGAGLFVFNTYIDQLGSDRTWDSTTAIPVVFSITSGNMSDVSHMTDRTTEITRVLVLGKGERSTRKVIAKNNATAQAASPWNIMEVARQASLNEYTYQLNNYGDAVLNEGRPIETLDGGILQTPASLYGLHYFLGDMVTVTSLGVSSDKQVTGVKFTLSGEGNRNENIEIILETL